MHRTWDAPKSTASGVVPDRDDSRPPAHSTQCCSMNSSIPAFAPVSDASDLDAPKSEGSGMPGWKEAFNPEFTHQFFGEDEIIFGYEDLKGRFCHSTGTGREAQGTARQTTETGRKA